MNLFAMVNTRASQRYTEHGLTSFFRHTPLAAGDLFFLIDNDSSLDADLVRTGHEDVLHIIQNKAPKGFAANVNQMLEIADGYRANLFFLNNDIIFTRDWALPLLNEQPWILSPLSNREVNHRTEKFICNTAMDLSEYVGREAEFEELVELHHSLVAQNGGGYYNVIVAPFFAVKLPYAIYKQVGTFDETFGIGGGEDYDYAVRAVLAGFSVKYALASFILHFGGKSSWSGAESRDQQLQREAKFRNRFEEKWGRHLADLILYEKRDVLDRFPGLADLVVQGELRQVVETLLNNRDQS